MGPARAADHLLAIGVDAVEPFRSETFDVG
jgi:hypothetical protein